MTEFLFRVDFPDIVVQTEVLFGSFRGAVVPAVLLFDHWELLQRALATR